MIEDQLKWVEELRRARQGKLIGGVILFFQQIDSTNTVAHAQALQGAPEGLVVLADAQSQGKGRRGRNWVSPPGLNLYFSVLLRPAVAKEKIAVLTLMAGVACAEALRNKTGLEVKIKWPNDLLIRERKVAGILAESETTKGFVILGIGVNVNWPNSEMPLEIRETATSLYAEKGEKFGRADIAQELLKNLEEEYLLFRREGFSSRLRAKWEELSAINQKWVAIKFLDKIYEGKALGLDEEGALLVQNGQGKVSRFLAGEVSLRF
ncbi:MAG: biotin--[acetyl-CoA-carboxylase] ligase [Thermodesulfobacteriota bacterium]